MNKFFLLTLITLVAFQGNLCHGQQSHEPVPGQLAGQPAGITEPSEPGLLFRLSGREGFSANYAAGGQDLPNYLSGVKITEEGPYWHAIEADDSQLLSYWAPGNIFAQRGTISFFWRSRYPVGPTEFPVFRVGYADHSSWDMVWLRIDYNGSGFDAFVTDIGLSRTRVSHYMDQFPEPGEWIHIALSWDETEGIRFYLNGILAENQSVTGMVYDSGLDQFGPHSRIISPYQVQSRYNFMRGGDIADLRIYDRMLADQNIMTLARGERLTAIPELKRDLTNRRWRDAWWNRHGWNLPNEPPPLLSSSRTSIRKVEIHDAFDVKRWYWKANDGIRETTWPGVYNMSRLPGRYDYFVLPDWDCYSVSGQTVRFHVPESEQWNHIEIWGTAWGQMTHENRNGFDHTFGVRRQNQVKSYHRLDRARKGGIIRFDNALIEEPIGSFMVYNVTEGRAPVTGKHETFVLSPSPAPQPGEATNEAARFIYGRYPSDERTIMTGIPEGAEITGEARFEYDHFTQPLIHILIPYTYFTDRALDGVEIELPAMDLRPTHNDLYPMNLRIKDPLWQMRDLADFSFSIKPGRSYTIWVDTRDRILPEGRTLYLTLAGAGADLTAETLKGAKIRLIYKPKNEGLDEHIADRFTQVRDLHAHNVEENPRTPRLNSYNRFYADLHDILRHEPEHWLAKAYWYWVTRDISDRPGYEISPPPAGVPEWAHLQVEYIRHLERIAMYYINERQISNGEFGGGLSDDGDFTNFFPGMALLGVQPERILESLRLHMTSYYDQYRDPYDAPLKQRSLPLFTNGLATIFTDELHAYEEGIQVVGQLQLLDFGIPLHINRAMETSKNLLDDITRINPHGNRLFRSRYYGGTRIAKEDPWQWSVSHSYHVLHPAYLLAKYNGNPQLIRMIRELADAVLAHRDDEGNIYTEIHFETGETRGAPGVQGTRNLFLAAWDLTGNKKYLEPVQATLPERPRFDPDKLAERYREEITELGVREYINTEGSLWIDRVTTRNHRAAQEDRLGGVALTRIGDIYPQHHVGWTFTEPSTYESLAVYVTGARPHHIELIAFNLEEYEITAHMSVWEVIPGRWRIIKGIDSNGDNQIDSYLPEKMRDLKIGDKLDLTFNPGSYTSVRLEHVEALPPDSKKRADLGIGMEDVRFNGDEITVRVHSLGAIGTPETLIELRDSEGGMVDTRKVPAMQAPVDLLPKWSDIRFDVPAGTDISSGSIIVDPFETVRQITRANTTVSW